MKKLMPIILIIILPIYILLFSLETNTFRLEMFEKSFIENNTVEVTKRPMDELMRISENLLDYLKGKDIDLSKDFDNREVEHMKDVEKLFHYGFILKKLLFTLIVILVFYIALNKKDIYKNLDILFKGLFIWWGVLIGFSILTYIDFTKYFTYFHLIFFDNDLWILDPDISLMINMLPEVFFINIFKNIVLLFLMILLIIHIIIYFLRKKNKINFS